MKEQLITFETAKLAKEKGLEITTERMYRQDGLLGHSDFSREITFRAPPQSLLQKWLREQFSLHIAINVGLPHNCPIMYYSNVIKFGMHHKSKFKSKFFSTYEEALEEGLQEALKLI
jgi:hypothetical protein